MLVSAPDGTRPRTVTVGLAGPEGVEVLDGVVAGDLVVVPDATLPVLSSPRRSSSRARRR